MYFAYAWRLFTADILNEIESGQSSEHSNENIEVNRRKRLRVVEFDSESDDKERYVVFKVNLFLIYLSPPFLAPRSCFCYFCEVLFIRVMLF